MDSDADGGISGLQHSRAAAPYESWLGYVFKKSRLEIRQDAGQVVQIHEETGIDMVEIRKDCVGSNYLIKPSKGGDKSHD